MTNNTGQPPQGKPTHPPVQERLIINWHGGTRVTASIPRDPQLAMLMIAQALVLYGQNLEFVEDSPIIKPRPGTRI
jgi:hypothetical protein